MSTKLELNREQLDEIYHEITENFEEFVQMWHEMFMYYGEKEVEKKND